MFLPLAVVDFAAELDGTTGLLQYVLVFLFAAIPVVEILVVIPVGIGLGLHPVVTGGVAFAGNVSSVLLLIGFQQRLLDWWRRRRGQPESSGRYARARQLWDRYGVPALGFAGPVLTGVHIAALVALAGGTRSRSVAVWMTTGIAVWTVFFVVGSVLGLSAVGAF